MLATAIRKTWHADDTRPTRFHTANSHLCIHPFDFPRALASTLLRKATGRLLAQPWITFPSFRALSRRVGPDTTVFEFGSGMSTVWFSRYCKRVISVEHDPAWADRVRSLSTERATIVLAETDDTFPKTISTIDHDAKYDVVVVDGFARLECLRSAVGRVNPGGLLLVDNTDAHPELAVELRRQFSDSQISRYPGYFPGIANAGETTICIVAK